MCFSRAVAQWPCGDSACSALQAFTISEVTRKEACSKSFVKSDTERHRILIRFVTPPGLAVGGAPGEVGLESLELVGYLQTWHGTFAPDSKGRVLFLTKGLLRAACFHKDVVDPAAAAAGCQPLEFLLRCTDAQALRGKLITARADSQKNGFFIPSNHYCVMTAISQNVLGISCALKPAT